ALARGDLAGAEDAARRAEQIDEHSDVAVRARLRALALAGDRGQALKAFAAFAERLQRDLGAEPDAETRALADRIRQGRAWRLPETASAPTGPESRRAPPGCAAAHRSRRRRGRFPRRCAWSRTSSPS